jgi:cytochrome c-type biogenesis protein CcmF
MHAFAYFCILAALTASLALGGLAAWSAWQRSDENLPWLERGQYLAAGLLSVASAILLFAFVTRDFSFLYVAEYSDTTLPMFYTVTAFWAGQDGSFLFWALIMGVCAAIFAGTRGYKEFTPRTRTWFWAFFFVVQAFFMYILTGPNNPFLKIVPPPVDGNGLNPLLRHPGMIFHPPLLFLGYAGFTVPACAALAALVAGEGGRWLRTCRAWTLLAWTFLTAGIILGAWWSYMELGWGGYWAWDPVENASLIPWLAATAFLHTAVIQATGRALEKTNVFLIALTLILCFFATYTVRSGVIDSLHAFGSGALGAPLLTFILLSLAVSVLAIAAGSARDVTPLSSFTSRHGLLLLVAWLLLAIGVVIFLGTMWPVISNLWTQNPEGLKPGFYNRVCLPLYTLTAVVLVFCPWLKWRGGIDRKQAFFAVLGVAAGALVLFYAIGIRHPVALVAAASSLAIVAGILLLFSLDRGMRRRLRSWGAYGVHFGLALVVLGIAFSGPYQTEKEAVLEKGQSVSLEEYEFTYREFSRRDSRSMVVFEARLEVKKDGEALGAMEPQRRFYRNFDQPFAEVSTITGLGDELYATLLGFDREERVTIKVSVHPLINWIWIGGTLMCLFPFVGLARRGRRSEEGA